MSSPATESSPAKFTGWGAFGKDSIEGNFKLFDYEPKKWDETDVDIKILYCGICASDLHTASSGWGEVKYPQVVGHEIVGHAVRVGKEVKHVKVGDLVGVGAQNDSCLECTRCKQDLEPYCDEGQVGTYNGIYKKGNGKGDQSYGGYANYHRAPGHFVIPIPAGVDPAHAAPLLCGGVTVFSPLKQYGAGTTAKDVGIVGLGGLGHFGVIFAKAMGANVSVISHSDSKKADAEKMGATTFIATGDGKADKFKPYARSLDLIISTNASHEMPLKGYLSLLRPGGILILVGVPEAPLTFHPMPLIMSNVLLGGSAIGSPKVIREMFEFVREHHVEPWIEKFPMGEVNKAVVDQHANKARFRYVLVTDEGAAFEASGAASSKL